jgi:hypothetical protein
MEWCGLNSRDCGQGQLNDRGENVNEFSGSLKSGEFQEQLSN